MKIRHLSLLAMMFFSIPVLAEDCVEGTVAIREPDPFIMDLYTLTPDALPLGRALMQCGLGGEYSEFVSTRYLYGTLRANRGNSDFVSSMERMFGMDYEAITRMVADSYLDGEEVRLMTPASEEEIEGLLAYADAHNGLYTRDNENFVDNVRNIRSSLNNMQFGKDIPVTDMSTFQHAVNHNELHARSVADRCQRGQWPNTPLFALRAEFPGGYTNPDGATGQPATDPATLTYFPSSLRDLGNGRRELTYRFGNQLHKRVIYQNESGQFYWIGKDGYHYEVNLQLGSVAKYQADLQEAWAPGAVACVAVNGVEPDAYSVPDGAVRTIDPPAGDRGAQ